MGFSFIVQVHKQFTQGARTRDLLLCKSGALPTKFLGLVTVRKYPYLLMSRSIFPLPKFLHRHIQTKHNLSYD